MVSFPVRDFFPNEHEEVIEQITNICELYWKANMAYQDLIALKDEQNSGDKIRQLLTSHLDASLAYAQQVRLFQSNNGNMIQLKCLLNDIQFK